MIQPEAFTLLVTATVFVAAGHFCDPHKHKWVLRFVSVFGLTLVILAIIVVLSAN